MHWIVMEITLLIMETHGIVFLNFCGNPATCYYIYIASLLKLPNVDAVSSI